jgi:nitroreductase
MGHQTRQPPEQPDRPSGSSELAAAVTELRAIRAYAPGAPDGELVARWLDAARWCGSSRNSQPWRFIVIEDPAVRAELAGLGEYAGHLADAPLVIVVAADPGPFPFSTVFDLGRVSQSLMLIAAADGFGSCIAVFEPPSNMDRARELLGVPDGIRLDLAIGFGRAAPAAPDGDAAAAGAHRPSPRGRRPLGELAFREVWGTAYCRS